LVQILIGKDLPIFDDKNVEFIQNCASKLKYFDLNGS